MIDNAKFPYSAGNATNLARSVVFEMGLPKSALDFEHRVFSG